MNRQPDDVDQADVEALLTMARVQLEASGHGADRAGAGDAPARVEAAASALGNAQLARVILGQQYIVGSTRFTFPKRVVLRASKLFTHRLVAAGQALADGVDALARAHRESIDDVERLGNSLRAQVVSIEIASQDAVDSLASRVLDSGDVPESATAHAVARFESEVGLLTSRVADLERERTSDRAELERLRALTGTGGPGPATAVLDDSTYVKFEQSFRGSAVEIRERQLDALRFVAPIVGNTAPLLDLGCGRGEWLALLRDAGIAAYGVDLSAGMVADAQALDLDARCADALGHLQDVAESSLQAVSAFHFAEHVPLSFLTQILDAAYLALLPGGTLLLETPNPTNLVVGAAAFYLDPTHLRPLHPEFLAFLIRSRGFTGVEIHYVHPTIDEATLQAGGPAQGYDPRLNRVVESAEWALFGPQDYVVVARRGEATV